MKMVVEMETPITVVNIVEGIGRTKVFDSMDEALLEHPNLSNNEYWHAMTDFCPITKVCPKNQNGTLIRNRFESWSVSHMLSI